MDKDRCKSWDDASKSALVAQIVSGKLSVKSACERHALSPDTIQDWVRVFRRTTLQAFDEHLRQAFSIQGADASALGSAEYTGTLDDIPIADLLQTFQLGSKGGVITITRGAQQSRIWCDKGHIIDAESGALRGEAAVYRIFGFESGQVHADFHAQPRAQAIEQPMSLLLLEAARRKDEGRRLIERLSGEQTVYRAARECSASAGTAERQVFDRFTGERSLEQVLELSDLGDLETLSAAASLVERGELQPCSTVLAPVPGPLAVRKDPSLGAASFLPLVASQRLPPARRGPSRAVLVAAGAAIGVSIWTLAALFPRAESAARRQPSALAAPGSDKQTFQVTSRVEPSHAELWLDGVKVGVGRLERELPRDGRPHSLRVAADGYAPTTLLFVDAPPPSHIALESLNVPAATTAHQHRGGQEAPVAPASSGARAPASPVEGVTEQAPRALRRAPPFRSGRGPAAASSGRIPDTSEPRAPEPGAARSDDAATAHVPRVQIIEDEAPVVRVIE